VSESLAAWRCFLVRSAEKVEKGALVSIVFYKHCTCAERRGGRAAPRAAVPSPDLRLVPSKTL